MSSTSIGFGILLLLQAVLSQSAPDSYQDDDEEALIDRLASLASQEKYRRMENRRNSGFSNEFDLPQLDYLSGFGLDMLSKQPFENLPRQFGYKPDDIRFFLDADQFPNIFPEHAPVNPEPERNYNYHQFNDHPSSIDKDENLAEPQRNAKAVDEWEPEQENRFMKKNNPEDYVGQSEVNHQGLPSNIMSHGHSADSPVYRVGDPNTAYPYTDIYYIALIAGCSAAAVVGVVAAGICWYRIHERVKAAADVDYPAYGVTGPSKDVSPCGGDRKLAQSAHMYHYQHQKQQMAVLQKSSLQGDRQGSAESDVESDDDNEEGDYTVYECPGLAPAGDMEVKNPLFQDEPTPASPQPVKFSEDLETGNK